MKEDTLTFVQYRGENEKICGGFVPPKTEEWPALQDELCRMNEAVDDQEEYFEGLLAVINREQTFLDAYAHIGHELLNNGEIKEAEDCYRIGLDIAQKLIPEDFSGRIPWSDLDNRPFLRLHHGYTLCHVRNQDIKKALQLMEEHLAWNPNDNLDVRTLLSEACQKAGMTHFKYNNLGTDQ